RSGEVWKILGAVKAQFDAFGEILSKVQRKLQQATNEIEVVGTKARTMQRRLRDVENLGVGASNELFGFANGEGSSARLDLPEGPEESSRADTE
ncbi:MAG: DNA recombination protein RmuC, partial [Terrimicrobiaceae bacterium]